MRGRIAVDVPRLSGAIAALAGPSQAAVASEVGPILGTTVEIRTQTVDKLHKNAPRRATK